MLQKLSNKKKLNTKTIYPKPQMRTKEEQKLFLADYNKEYNKIIKSIKKKGLNSGGMFGRWAESEAYYYAESQEEKRKDKSQTKSSKLNSLQR